MVGWGRGRVWLGRPDKCVRSDENAGGGNLWEPMGDDDGIRDSTWCWWQGCCRFWWRRCTPVCRLCGRYLAILGRPIRVTVPAVTVAPTALVGSLIWSPNLPHSLQRGVHGVEGGLSPFHASE